MTITTVVFDIGEVLIDWNPRYLYRKIFAEVEEMEYFLASVCDSGWNARQDEGYPWAAALAEKIAQFPKYESQIRAYHARWPEMVRGGVDGSVRVLQRLKDRGTPVYAITNYNQETFALSQTLWPFLTLFDGIVVSGTERMLKPDPRIYRLLLDRYDLSAPSCVFIDDRLENVKGAENVGMSGIHFQDPAQMERDLKSLIGDF